MRVHLLHERTDALLASYCGKIATGEGLSESWAMVSCSDCLDRRASSRSFQLAALQEGYMGTKKQDRAKRWRK